MARVAFYGRVSGHQQEEEETIETQWHYLEAWAKSEGHEVVGRYGDENCRSWVPVAERAEGGRLLREAARKRFEMVAIYRLGRWSRYLEVWHEGRRALRALGVELVCINEDARDDRPGDRFSLNVRLLVNEYERDSIATVCADGRYRRATEGGYVGGAVPYGYRVADDTGGRRARRLVIDEREAAVVREIFRRLAEEGATGAGLARALTARGVPSATASHDDGRHRPKRGARPGVWHPSAIYTIVRNPIYYGEAVYGETSQRAAVAVPVPALVARATWDAAQAQLQRNRANSRRNTQREYLLRGLLWCPVCRRTLVGRTDSRRGREYRYYRCPGPTPAHPDPVPCGIPSLRAGELEADLWARVVDAVRHHEETARALRRDLARHAADTEGLTAARDGHTGSLQRLRSEKH